MRLNLNLEELHVETTVMQPDYVGPAGMEGYQPHALIHLPGTSRVWDTQTNPIPEPDTNSSPCIA